MIDTLLTTGEPLGITSCGQKSGKLTASQRVLGRLGNNLIPAEAYSYGYGFLFEMAMTYIVKECSCGRKYSFYEWCQLPLVGYQIATNVCGEMRNCPCNSTIILITRG